LNLLLLYIVKLVDIFRIKIYLFPNFKKDYVLKVLWHWSAGKKHIAIELAGDRLPIEDLMYTAGRGYPNTTTHLPTHTLTHTFHTFLNKGRNIVSHTSYISNYIFFLFFFFFDLSFRHISTFDPRFLHFKDWRLKVFPLTPKNYQSNNNRKPK